MDEEKSEGESGMKSALEIALEKTARFQKEAVEAKLTPEQKAQIEEIEKDYTAKLAEKDVMFQSNIKQLTQTHGPSEELYGQLQLMREAFNKERATLQEEKEAKIQDIRQKKN